MSRLPGVVLIGVALWCVDHGHPIWASVSAVAGAIIYVVF